MFDLFPRRDYFSSGLCGKECDLMDRTVIESIKPFMVMEVLERALELEKKGRSIIHMEIGEPDFPTPKKIIRAGIESLLAGDTHYTDSRGIPELRLAIAEYCGETVRRHRRSRKGDRDDGGLPGPASRPFFARGK